MPYMISMLNEISAIETGRDGHERSEWRLTTAVER